MRKKEGKPQLERDQVIYIILSYLKSMKEEGDPICTTSQICKKPDKFKINTQRHPRIKNILILLKQQELVKSHNISKYTGWEITQDGIDFHLNVVTKYINMFISNNWYSSRYTTSTE